MDNITGHAVILKDSIFKLYDEITAKVSPRKIFLPLSGICFVYYFFIRRTEGKKDPIIEKEPCLPDEQYTGHEEPSIKAVRRTFGIGFCPYFDLMCDHEQFYYLISF